MIIERAGFAEILEKLASETTLALDLETTGLRPYHGDQPLSVILADKVSAYYFNFWEYERLDPKYILPKEHFKTLIDSLKDKTVYLANAKFDLHFSKPAALPTWDIHDVLVVERLLENNRIEAYSLENVAKKYGFEKSGIVEEYITKHHLWEWVIIPGKKTRVKNKFFYKVPFELMSQYGLQDGRITYEIGERQKKLYKEKQDRYGIADKALVYEKRLTPVLYKMESRGVLIDRDYCTEAVSYLRNETALLEDKIRSELGTTTFKDSAKFLGPILTNLGVTLSKTAKGNDQVDSKLLEKSGIPVCQTILQWRQESKRLNTYFRAFLYGADEKGFIHTNFRQAGTASGRMSCIAQGTEILGAGFSKPIESVLVGDMVYCYDATGKLRLRKVLKTFNQGLKKCITLHFKSSGDGRIVTLTCTPDHKIKTSRGWVRADSLVEGQKVFHLRKSKYKDRIRIYGTENVMELEEGFLKREFFKADSNLHIHHIDENKGNNSLDNLAVCTQVGHNRIHAFSKGHTVGKPQARKREVTKFWLYREIVRTRCRPTLVDMDFTTFKRNCAIHGIPLQRIGQRYSSKGIYLNRTNVERASEGRSVWTAAKKLGVGLPKFKKLCLKYGITYNHRFLRAEEVGYFNTYDLHVEDHSNFIANEICVHNCTDPNLQNQISEDPEALDLHKYPIKKAFIPRPGMKFSELDYDQMEFRLMLLYAGQKDLMRKIMHEGLDPHQATADLTGLTRRHAKTYNFSILFGSGAQTIADMLESDLDTAKKLKRQYFDALPLVEQFIKQCTYKAKREGWTKTWDGRLHLWPEPNYAYKAVNYVIQGGCAGIVKQAMNTLDDRLFGRNAWPLVQVHDSLLLEYDPDNTDAPEIAKEVMENVLVSPEMRMTVSVEHKKSSWHE